MFHARNLCAPLALIAITANTALQLSRLAFIFFRDAQSVSDAIEHPTGLQLFGALKQHQFMDIITAATFWLQQTHTMEAAQPRINNTFRSVNLWKVILIQDVVLFTVLGVGMLAYPAKFLEWQSWATSKLPLPGIASKVIGAVTQQSELVTGMLAMAGCLCLALAYCWFSFYQSARPAHAFWLHSVLFVTLTYAAKVGGWAHRPLYAWAAHDLLMASLLLLSSPEKVIRQVRAPGAAVA